MEAGLLFSMCALTMALIHLRCLQSNFSMDLHPHTKRDFGGCFVQIYYKVGSCLNTDQ